MTGIATASPVVTCRVLASHTSLNPIGDDWQAQLVSLMGSKPRRLSRWCELGLWGALSCMRNASLQHLPGDVPIRVYSETGTANATHKALAQLDDYLPMPVTFMQTLPGQLFNAIGTALGWHGDGCTVAGANRRHTELVLLRNMQSSALLAWVDELPEAVSRWVYLERASLLPDDLRGEAAWQPLVSVFAIDATTTWLRLDADGHLFQGR